MTDQRAVLARAVAAAVSAVPGVAGLDPDGPVRVRTLHAGGSVDGVALRGEGILVQVAVTKLPLAPVIDAVRAAVATVAPAHRCEVRISELIGIDTLARSA